jgi:hypothetical protein
MPNPVELGRMEERGDPRVGQHPLPGDLPLERTAPGYHHLVRVGPLLGWMRGRVTGAVPFVE